MTPRRASSRPSGEPDLVTFLNGARVGSVYQANGSLRFRYEESWRQNPDAYPLSLSMPLAGGEHAHRAINAFLWGLLPDNPRTLAHYGRLFGVNAGSVVSLLRHLGADCAGAVQFSTPDRAETIERTAPNHGEIQLLGDDAIAEALRTVRQQGIPGTSASTVGQFSLAGAQPKIALREEQGRWSRPSGRLPTNRILKPPTGEYRGFAENEHYCLELAGALALGSVRSRVAHFAGETAIVVERFDRDNGADIYVRTHQEDVCQALAVMPNEKYEAEGGPGLIDIVGVLRETSSHPEDDMERLLRATALNWVLAATDAHAKNYALLHGPRGALRLAPFYDILSFLPYAAPELHRVKLAMRVGSEYLVRRVTRRHWVEFAAKARLDEHKVIDNVLYVLDHLPAANNSVAERAIHDGLDEEIVIVLRDRIQQRTARCQRLIMDTRAVSPEG